MLTKAIILSLVLFHPATTSAQSAENDPLDPAGLEFKITPKEKIRIIHISLGPEVLLSPSGIEILPAKLAITDEKLIARIVKAFSDEEELKHKEFLGNPVGSYKHYVDFLDEQGARIHTVFLYAEGTGSKFDPMIKELIQRSLTKH